MDWAAPGALIWLWLVPGVVLLLALADRRRDQGRAALLGAFMQARLAPPPSRGRRWLKRLLIAAGMAALVAAVARPRWGTYYEDVAARGVDVFVLIDTSRSMLATDVAPTRLERARADVRDFLARVQGDRIGLIAFAGAAVVKCPLTLDHTFFDLALSDLDINSAPRGGTLIGDAIRVALRSFAAQSSERTRLILLISDGDDQDSYPREAAAAAAEQGVRIITVGLGDPAIGALVPDAEGGTMTHAGELVRSAMNMTTLEEVASLTGGIFVPAGTRQHDLGKIYDEHVAPLFGEEITGNKRSRLHERYQWFGALALAAFIAEMIVGSYARRTTEPGP